MALLVLIAALAVAGATGCAANRQHATIVLAGDVPRTDVRGRLLSAPESARLGRTLSRRVIASYRCVGARSCRRPVPVPKVTPLARLLGRPPQPTTYVTTLPRGWRDDPQQCEIGRGAYIDAIRIRYRLWSDHVVAQLEGAEEVRVAPLDAADRERRGSTAATVRAALAELADQYGSLEWERFIATTPPAPSRRRARPRRRAVRTVTTTSAPSSPPVTTTTHPPRSDVCHQACGVRNASCVDRCRDGPTGASTSDDCVARCARILERCHWACARR